MVLHGVARRDGVGLREFGEFVFAAGVRYGGFFDDEVGAEGGGGDFVACV